MALIGVAILLIFNSTLQSLAVPELPADLVLAVIALNSWTFRYFLAFPEIVNDAAFMLGVAILLNGLVKRRGTQVLAGQLIASLSRQTGLLLVPLVVLWARLATEQSGRIGAYRSELLSAWQSPRLPPVCTVEWQRSQGRSLHRARTAGFLESSQYG